MNPCDPAFLETLGARLAPDTLRAVEPRHLSEPRGKFGGGAGAVALPRTAAEVSVIVAACAAARVAIVPLGGGTGLVGGQVMAGLPLLISTERMTGIEVFPAENALVAGAGAILADIQTAALNAGRLFPLSLASEGSVRIGGALSTNAGGLNVLRYGTARDLCLGLQAVLPDGTVWNGLRRLRKDNTGYDLRGLMIGAEGTLGIITAASLKLFPIPARVGTALLAVESPAAALELLGLAEGRLPGMVQAFELISRQGPDFLAQTMPEVRLPLVSDWMVLVELGLPEGLDPVEALEGLFVDAGLEDGLIAMSEAQRQEFWTMRESIPEANRHIGAIASHDVSLPLGSVPEFIARAEVALAGFGLRVNCFGHMGDGNLHYNAFPAEGRSRAEYDAAAITRAVHDLVHDMDGSVSAEHGIGRLKVPDLVRYGDPAKLAAMRAIKRALDPAGIMNPGAVLALE